MRSFVATEVQMKIHDLDKICVDIVVRASSSLLYVVYSLEEIVR